MAEEIWKDIKGYEGLYQVSNKGRVKSLKRKGVGSDRILPGRPAGESGSNRALWRLVGLTKNLKGEARKMHHLVAEAFIPNPDNCTNVRHLNDDPDDNRPENLEWYIAQGEDSKVSKLTEKEVLNIRSKYEAGGYTYKELGEEYGVTPTSIWSVVKRRHWKHI